jgi:GntR family transcriptional regulator
MLYHPANGVDQAEGEWILPMANASKRDAITDALAGEIATGVYPHDTRLPSEAELCERFGVSRITVRGALDRLAVAGLVTSVRGHGWYIRGDQRRRFPLLTIDERGGTTRDVWRTWLEAQGLRGDHDLTVTVGLPPHHVARHLALPPDAQCAIRHRIRSINDEPVMISTAYFPCWLATGTELGRTGHGAAVDLDKPSPLDILAQLGHAPAQDEDQIGARMPELVESRELQLPTRGVPVITNCRTSFDAAGVPVRCTHDVMAAHRFLLVVHHVKPQETP